MLKQTNTPTTPLTSEDIWKLFEKTGEELREVTKGLREAREKTKETEALLDKLTRETDARLDKRFRETDDRIRRAEGLFTSQWGKFIEALVQPNALKLFQKRGISVRYSYPRVESHLDGETMEIDLILENDHLLIATEVKSVLKVSHIDEFLIDLDNFLRFFPKYTGWQIYGAVAGLTIEENADRYAYRRGLFVLSVVGEGIVQIRNDAKFRPRNFNQATSTNGEH